MNNRIDPFDELAAMFLTAPQPHPLSDAGGGVSSPLSSSSAMPHAPRAVLTELLLVGHLPVRAGLWLAPYADALARQAGSVALVRLDGQEPTLQLYRAAEALGAAPLRMPMQQTIHDLAGCVDAWMLRGSERMSADEVIDCRPDRVTILSSADEAAVVAAYQMIKELVQAAEHPHRTLPPLGMAMVGCDVETADAVIDRLNRTTVSFLGVEAKLVALLPRMDAGIKCTRYVTFGAQEAPSMMDVRTWIEQMRLMPARDLAAGVGAGSQASGSAAPRAADQPDVIGRVAPSPEAFVVDASRILRPPSPWQAPPETPAAPAAATTPPAHVPPTFKHPAAPVAPSVAASSTTRSPASSVTPSERDNLIEAIAPGAVRLPPKVVIDLEHKPPMSQRPMIEPDDQGQPIPLARFVTGLTTLALRPPGHERVEIALDARGVLHLLTREAGLRELPVVARWATAHRELLALAFPQQPFDFGARAVCHVFSSEPALLADLHGSDLRLHVLAPVTVGDKTAWYAAPLNVVT